MSVNEKFTKNEHFFIKYQMIRFYKSNENGIVLTLSFNENKTNEIDEMTENIHFICRKKTNYENNTHTVAHCY